MTRIYGRIIGGDRLHEPVPGKSWDTTTVLSSIRYNGSLAPMTIDGAIDADVFRTYVSQVLCPTLRKGDIVVMDNLPTHKVSGISELIKKAGAKLLYLPPYSPDYNPIEKMWSKIKSILRKMKARSKEDLTEALTVAFNEISSSDAHGWFESCGYGLI
jgi:transposase